MVSPTSEDASGLSMTGDATAVEVGVGAGSTGVAGAEVGGGSISVATAEPPGAMKTAARRHRPKKADAVDDVAARRRRAADRVVPGKWVTYLPFRGLVCAKSKSVAFA
jgi:hypothetical protein